MLWRRRWWKWRYCLFHRDINDFMFPTVKPFFGFFKIKKLGLSGVCKIGFCNNKIINITVQEFQPELQQIQFVEKSKAVKNLHDIF